MKEIIVADCAGTCPGVARAISMAFEAAKDKKLKGKLFILGQLVHNPRVVKALGKKGIKTIKDINELKKGDHLIIRAHGERKQVYEYCKLNKINIIDATCAFVRNAQQIAAKLSDESYNVFIIGDPEHPEVLGIADRADDPVILEVPQDIETKGISKFKGIKAGIVSQTTQSRENFDKIISALKPLAKELNVNNTICDATKKRQESAEKLSKKVDVMIVIGGKNSANTKRLYEICSNNIKTYWIEDSSELNPELLLKIKDKNIIFIGITAGASTPHKIIAETIKLLE